MSRSQQSVCHALILLALAGASPGCKPRPTAAPPAPPDPRTAAQQTAAQVATTAGAVVINGQDGSRARIERQGESFAISFAAEAITCQARDARKRICRNQAGAMVAEVKAHEREGAASEGSLKLLATDGKLRWKVKWNAEKIKISDNEENRDPWTLSLKHADHIAVDDPKEKRVGVARRAEGGLTKVQSDSHETLYTVEGAGQSAAPGLLLVSAISPDECLILMAELLARGL